MLTVEIPVQLHLELEVNLLVHNVIEREIERENVQMKPPFVLFIFLDFCTLCNGLLYVVSNDNCNDVPKRGKY